MKNKIIKNTFFNILGKSLNYAIQILILTYLVKKLGAEEYGIFVFAIALVSSSNLLEAGFGLASTKFIAEYNAKKEVDVINKIANTNFLINTFFALFLGIIIFFINEFFLNRILKISGEYINLARESIRILVVLSFFEFWIISFIRIMEGFQDYFYARIFENIKWFFRFLFVLILSNNIVYISLAYLIAGIVEFFLIFVFFLNRYKFIKFSFLNFDFEVLKINFKFSIWIFLSKISSFIIYRINTLVLGVFLEVKYLTYYSIASKVYELLKYGISLLSSAIIPVASHLNAQDNFEKLKKLYNKSTYYSIIIFMPIIILGIFFCPLIIKLWLGNGFEKSYLITSLMCASLIPTIITAPGAEIFVGIGKLKEIVIYGLFSSIIGFIIMILLIPNYKLIAVGISMIISSFIVSIGYHYEFRKYFKT